MKKILIPLPNYGFDPTECAIPYKILSEKGYEITFATPEGKTPKADSKMLFGENLGIFKNILMARKDAVSAYHEMKISEAFKNPIKYEEAKEENFDAIFLPGGHDKGMREYLESEILQNLISKFFEKQKPVGAICHGVVLVCRSKNPETQKSVLYDYKTTALLKSQELLAYNMTRLWLGDYYLTYPEITVEDEVKSTLKNPENFLKGKTPISRDSENNLKVGFVVKDRNYISARWPGDIYSFSLEFLKLLS